MYDPDKKTKGLCTESICTVQSKKSCPSFLTSTYDMEKSEPVESLSGGF
jgi:hypothetical protein